jgi:hypothetical protein
MMKTYFGASFVKERDESNALMSETVLLGLLERQFSVSDSMPGAY